ncbi:MAG TPA: hypothetical protein VGX69_00455 [Solirubrobacteraceae bacterium]|jgi:hypothetical protein|nr:hypothetical protein [Solirubrobacteraceae bacterium]
MSLRTRVTPLAAAAGMALAALAASTLPPAALGARSVGTSSQIAWVRRAASNFVADELSGNGAGACSILNSPLQATQAHRTCAQRWDAKLAGLRREPDARAQLRAQARAIGSAIVLVHGDSASIVLPSPLLGGASRFAWTDNCWMLTG